MRPGIGRRAFPGRPVAGGDAGVGTAGRLAQGGEWLRGIGGRHALEAERGRGIEEAIRERRSEEHTSELQSLMRISYAVFCLKKKTKRDIERIISQSKANYTYNVT